MVNKDFLEAFPSSDIRLYRNPVHHDTVLHQTSQCVQCIDLLGEHLRNLVPNSSLLPLANQLTTDGSSILHIAVILENEDMIFAISRLPGIDINLPSSKGITPIKLARFQKKTLAVEALIKLGAKDTFTSVIDSK